jgi:hypothetical protein
MAREDACALRKIGALQAGEKAKLIDVPLHPGKIRNVTLVFW